MSDLGFELAPTQVQRFLRDPGALSPCFRATFALDRTVDAERLEEALRALVDRHEILRTAFPRPGGMAVPIMKVAERLPTLLHLECEEGPEERHVPLSEDVPPTRFVLHRPKEGVPRLVLEASPLQLDPASVAVLARELGSLYAGDRIVEDPIQFGDLAGWMLELGEDEGTAHASRHWERVRARRAGDPELPFGVRPRREGQGKLRERPSRMRELAGKARLPLLNLAEAHDLSLEELFLAAWVGFLRRFGDSERFDLAFDCGGRTYEELGDSVGRIARSVPLTFSPDLGAPFLELATQVASVTREAVDVQEHYRPGSAEVPPSVGYGFIDLGEAQGLPISPVSVRDRDTSYALALSVVDRGSDTTLELHYDPSLFTRETIDLLLDGLATLLDAIVASPDAALGGLSLLSSSTRKHTVERWCLGSDCPLPSGRIEALISRWAELEPDAPAIVSDGKVLSYAELSRRANAVAHDLAKRGLPKGAPVGLCVERSPELFVGMLGILEAGGAYVPIDPALPDARVGFLVRDAGISLCVADASRQDVLLGAGLELLSPSEARGSEALPPKVDAGETDLAYIIYTSGSTGEPKGVRITHRQLMASTAARKTFYPRPPSRYLLLSSFAFDSSVAGIFWTLTEGGALVLPAEGEERDVDALADLVARHRVKTTLGLPSLIRILVDQRRASSLESLETVIVAGEACPSDLADHLGQHLPSATLYNEYGPTEGTVWCTAHRCDAEAKEPRVPIGRPVPGYRVYVLDSHLSPVFPGETGELCIGGPGVAEGYHHRQALTEERFVTAPFDGGRLYRTGDRVRHRPGGTLDFLGRSDDQVKISGHRIELGEVESALLAREGIEEVAVVVHASSPSDPPRLCAHYAAEAGAQVAVEHLREALESRLPAPMIPSFFVPHPRLPRLPNGKIDRRALPAPDGRPAGSPPLVEPRDAAEEIVAGIWAEVLGLPAVGVRDDFFALGGTSLMVTQVVARVRNTLRCSLALRAVFDHPTVEALCSHLRSAEEGGGRIDKVAQIVAKVLAER